MTYDDTANSRNGREVLSDKLFGFIAISGGESDTFVHQFDVEGRTALRPGQRVSFIPTMTAKGRRALDVVIEDEGRA